MSLTLSTNDKKKIKIIIMTRFSLNFFINLLKKFTLLRQWTSTNSKKKNGMQLFVTDK